MEQEECYPYIRVSTDMQDGSLQVQEHRIREYCAFHHLKIKEILVDENISGFKPIYKRPSGQKLQNLGDVKNIVAMKPDRLFRNVSDALLTVDEWNSNNIALHLADIGGASLNTKTAIGRLMFTTIISFAEFERNIIGERTSAVLQHKKNSGSVYCGEIYGYDKVGGFLIKNESEQLIIQKIIQMKEQDCNNNQIAMYLNNRGVKTKNGKAFQGSTVQSILNNPIHKQVA
jgi:DNA invertase Pin-like site-specific DNA recombinase